jgi:hypothetical protein
MQVMVQDMALGVPKRAHASAFASMWSGGLAKVVELALDGLDEVLRFFALLLGFALHRWAGVFVSERVRVISGCCYGGQGRWWGEGLWGRWVLGGKVVLGARKVVMVMRVTRRG